MKTPEELLELLKEIPYPGYSRDIVSFGMVKDIEIGSDRVTVTLVPGGAREDAVDTIAAEVKKKVREATSLERVDIQLDESSPKKSPKAASLTAHQIDGVEHVIAVASGKGGVGKSTVSTNLALALSEAGHRVGLVDADIYGPSIALMLGVDEAPRVDENERFLPSTAHGIQVLSMGQLLKRGQPVIWRGPMITKMLTQFIHDAAWDNLDFLVLDLPPGTGDAQLTITQQAPIRGGVIVTTPQDVALADVERGIRMFEQVGAPVMGIVENMSYYTCSCCGERMEIFGSGGGHAMAERFGVPLLGEIPLVPALREAADGGLPLVAAEPAHPLTATFIDIAKKIASISEKAASEDLSRLPTIS